MFKGRGHSSCAYLSKWTYLTKSNLEYQWLLLQGTFEISQTFFLKTKLDNPSAKIGKDERNPYFEYYLRLTKNLKFLHCAVEF